MSHNPAAPPPWAQPPGVVGSYPQPFMQPRYPSYHAGTGQYPSAYPPYVQDRDGVIHHPAYGGPHAASAAASRYSAPYGQSAGYMASSPSVGPQYWQVEGSGQLQPRSYNTGGNPRDYPAPLPDVRMGGRSYADQPYHDAASAHGNKTRPDALAVGDRDREYRGPTSGPKADNDSGLARDRPSSRGSVESSPGVKNEHDMHNSASKKRSFAESMGMDGAGSGSDSEDGGEQRSSDHENDSDNDGNGRSSPRGPGFAPRSGIPRRNTMPENARQKLEVVYGTNRHPNGVMRQTLADELGIAFHKVTNWFRNRRQKESLLRRRVEESDRLRGIAPHNPNKRIRPVDSSADGAVDGRHPAQSTAEDSRSHALYQAPHGGYSAPLRQPAEYGGSYGAGRAAAPHGSLVPHPYGAHHHHRSHTNHGQADSASEMHGSHQNALLNPAPGPKHEAQMSDGLFPGNHGPYNPVHGSPAHGHINQSAKARAAQPSHVGRFATGAESAAGRNGAPSAVREIHGVTNPPVNSVAGYEGHHTGRLLLRERVRIAVESGDVAVLKDIIARGARDGSQLTSDSKDLTPPDVVGGDPILSESVAYSVDMPLDADGNTALHVAAASGMPEVLRILVDYGAYADAKNLSGGTPLHSAINGERCYVKMNMMEVARILLSNLPLRNSAGLTPLLEAAHNLASPWLFFKSAAAYYVAALAVVAREAALEMRSSPALTKASIVEDSAVYIPHVKVEEALSASEISRGVATAKPTAVPLVSDHSVKVASPAEAERASVVMNGLFSNAVTANSRTSAPARDNGANTARDLPATISDAKRESKSTEPVLSIAERRCRSPIRVSSGISKGDEVSEKTAGVVSDAKGASMEVSISVECPLGPASGRITPGSQAAAAAKLSDTMRAAAAQSPRERRSGKAESARLGEHVTQSTPAAAVRAVAAGLEPETVAVKEPLITAFDHRHADAIVADVDIDKHCRSVANNDETSAARLKMLEGVMDMLDGDGNSTLQLVLRHDFACDVVRVLLALTEDRSSVIERCKGSVPSGYIRDMLEACEVGMFTLGTAVQELLSLSVSLKPSIQWTQREAPFWNVSKEMVGLHRQLSVLNAELSLERKARVSLEQRLCALEALQSAR